MRQARAPRPSAALSRMRRRQRPLGTPPSQWPHRSRRTGDPSLASEPGALSHRAPAGDIRRGSAAVVHGEGPSSRRVRPGTGGRRPAAPGGSTLRRRPRLSRPSASACYRPPRTMTAAFSALGQSGTQPTDLLSTAIPSCPPDCDTSRLAPGRRRGGCRSQPVHLHTGAQPPLTESMAAGLPVAMQADLARSLQEGRRALIDNDSDRHRSWPARSGARRASSARTCWAGAWTTPPAR